jgi:hypothetical protein
MYIICEHHGPSSALHAPRGPLCYTGLLSVKRMGPKITTGLNSGEWCMAYCNARRSEQAVTYIVIQQYRCITSEQSIVSTIQGRHGFSTQSSIVVVIRGYFRRKGSDVIL